MGHHFLRREWGLPKSISDSPFGLLNGKGMQRGQFYELHFKADPNFYGTRFPASIGGTWSGNSLGLEKAEFFGRMWYGSPTPLKLGVGGAAAGAAGAAYYFGGGPDE